MKYDLRLKLVQYARAQGNKPAAREFGCDIKTVRLWRKRYEADRSRSSLMDRSHAPKSCPHKTSPQMETHVVQCRKQAPCLGARRLKQSYDLAPGHNAISRILRQRGLTEKRKKKYEKKRDMREIKAQYQFAQQIQIDVKYLTDIPYYLAQLLANKSLPKFEYTARDVRTGAVWLGFANTYSEAHSVAFVRNLANHLIATGRPLNGFTTIQTDNGPEFSGMERTPSPVGFTAQVQSRLGATHRFIPPGRKNHQADVETLHHHIEREFFDLERFKSRHDFFIKVSAWQLWWNTTRPNSYKGNKTPDQIALELDPNRNPAFWLTPAFDLDLILNQRIQNSIRPPPLPQHPRGEDQPRLPDVGSARSFSPI
jgi:transposase